VGCPFRNTIAIIREEKNGEAFIAGNIAKSEMIRRVMFEPK